MAIELKMNLIVSFVNSNKATFVNIGRQQTSVPRYLEAGPQTRIHFA